MEGFRELSRAFAAADKTLEREFKASLKEAAEPVRSDAERLATVEISRIGLRWSQMRIGVTRRSVYVAPKRRGTKIDKARRPNLAKKLADEAMVPALDHNIDRVERRVDQVLADVGRAWERG